MITKFTKSDLLSKRAQEIIPGGAHTYSKGADQSPLLGPKVMTKGKGAYVWDVDGNCYVDWTMGLASISLGHAYEPVLEAVRNELGNGSNFNCPSLLEIEFAEFLLKELPGMEMVKFAKNGSTVTTAAVKLARAYTKKNIVAYCSDHGFFSYDDWYIGTKPNSSGVPDPITKMSVGFRYNDIESLEKVFLENPNQVACVILEPMEFDFPQNDFLKKVRELCDKYEAVMILDEMISGFRVAYPGAYTMFNVVPDLTTWGKGIANGFSTCVLAGKKSIMELGGINHDKDRVFLISSTHGAETHSLAAAMATIKTIKNEKSVERNFQTGKIIAEKVGQLLHKYGLEKFITIKGHPCWQIMTFRGPTEELNDSYKTLFFQEVLKKEVFFRGIFLVTISHGSPEIEKTLEAFDYALSTYRKAIDQKSVAGFLVGDPIKPVFRKKN